MEETAPRAPVGAGSEFAVYAFPKAAGIRIAQTRERDAQDLFHEYAPEDGFAGHVHVGRGRRVAGHGLRALIVVVVMAASAAEGDGEGHARAAPARAPDALLVVEPSRRHVRQRHRFQRADVHPRLHRGGDAEQVDAVHLRAVLLIADEHFLKPALALGAVFGVRLPGELFAVETERRPRLLGEIYVVVVAFGNRAGFQARIHAVGADGRRAGGTQEERHALRTAPAFAFAFAPVAAVADEVEAVRV